MAKRKTKNSKAPVLAVVFILLCVLVLIIFLLPEGDTQPKGNDVVDGLKNVEYTSGELILTKDTLPDATKDVAVVNETAETNILLNGDKVEIDGTGAEFDGKTLLINRPGTFSLKGKLSDGRILVNAKGEDIVLILDGVEVFCSDTAPLYVYNANSTTVILNGTTENKFSDGANYKFGYDYCSEVDGDPNAVIYSKDDLIIRGTGTLIVEGNYNNGITSKDNLSIINTTVNVTAKDNGINGKDSLTITNSDIKVKAGKDAIRSTQDADSNLGWIQITDSNLDLDSVSDGIQAETAVSLNNSSVYIKTSGSGDKNENLAESSSSKGIKVSQGYLSVNGGSTLVESSDDCFNVTGDITLNGSMTLSSGDEAVHSDNAIIVNGGNVTVTASNEGLEGKVVEINDGGVYLTAKDDGINTVGEYDDSNEMQSPFTVQSDAYISINGGTVVIDAKGDGVDSNGNIYMTGGTLIVNGPENGGNGAIDYGGDFYLEGGTLVACGAAGMAQAPDNATQNTLALNFGQTLSKGTCFTVEGAGESFTFCLTKNAECVIFSSPMLKTGETYTVTYNGKYSDGTIVDGICSEDGKVSGDKKLGEVTINDYLTSYGSVGIGGSRGGQMFGSPDGFGGHHGEGKQPPQGGFPQAGMGRPDGNMGMPNGDMPNGEMPNGEPPEFPMG